MSRCCTSGICTSSTAPANSSGGISRTAPRARALAGEGRSTQRPLRFRRSQNLSSRGTCRADAFELRQVVALAGAHEEVLLAVALLGLRIGAAIVDGHFACPDHFELLAVDHDGRALVDRDAQQLGVLRDDLFEIVL